LKRSKPKWADLKGLAGVAEWVAFASFVENAPSWGA
jgi:hypothetical protein